MYSEKNNRFVPQLKNAVTLAGRISDESVRDGSSLRGAQRRSNPEIHDLWIASFPTMTKRREKACCKDITKGVIVTRFQFVTSPTRFVASPFRHIFKAKK
jgi:hypothetical protein